MSSLRFPWPSNHPKTVTTSFCDNVVDFRKVRQKRLSDFTNSGETSLEGTRKYLLSIVWENELEMRSNQERHQINERISQLFQADPS